MRLLPEARNSRFLALVLLLIAVLAVYLLGVHWWFVSPHLAIADQMGDLREQESRFSQIVAQRPQIERRLAEARAFEQNNQAFLTDPDANSAFSDIVQRLKQTIAAHAGESNACQIVSTSPFKAPEEELYQRVSAQVRMRCNMERFSPIVYDLESGNPFLFLDRMTIYRQIGGYVPPGGKRQQAPSALEIQFNLSGYLRQPGKAAP